MKTLRRLLLLLLLVLSGLALGWSSPSAAAPTCTKTLVASGSFTAAGSWSPAGIPTAADYVCIPSGLTATLSTTRSVDGARVEGALAGAGTLVVNDTGVASPSELDGTVSSSLRVDAGQLVVTSGNMDGAGTTRVAAGASLVVRNPDYYGLFLGGSSSLVNEGLVRLEESAGSGYASLLLNEAGTSYSGGGVLELVDGADVAGSGVARVPTAGVVRSVTAGATSSVDVLVELAGRVDPSAGSLRLGRVVPPTAGASTGVLTSSGGSLVVQDVTVPAGSRISTQGTGVTLDGTVDGAGELVVSSGSVTAESLYAPGSGTMRVVSGATLVVRNPDYYGLFLGASRSLVNDGSVRLEETVGAGYASLLLNEAGTSVVNNATMELLGGADVAGSGSLVNTASGTLTKTTGTTTSDMAVGVENDGAFVSTRGLLDVFANGSGGLSTGSFTSAPTASLEVGGVTVGDGAALLGPTTAGSGRVTIDGPPVLIPTGATVSATGRTGLSGTVEGVGSLAVTSGTMVADSAYQPGAVTTRVLPGASLVVRNPDYYGLFLGGSSSLVNEGLVRLEESAGSGYASLLLNEAGTSYSGGGVLELVDGADVAGSGVARVPTAGVVRSVTAGATSSVDVLVELAGRVDPSAGSLRLGRVVPPTAGASTGVLTSSGGSLVVQDVTVPAGSRISTQGTGVTLDGTVDGAGELVVSSGSVTAESLYAPGSGTMRVVSGATLVVRNPDYYGLFLGGSRSLVNDGSVRLEETVGAGYASLLLNEAGTSVVNNATMELLGGADVAGSGSLVNTASGTLTKTTTTQTSTVSSPADNRGTARSENGVLDFTGPFPSLSGTTLVRGTYEMLSPGKIKLPGDVVRDDATILLDGPAAAMQDSASAANALGNLTRVGPSGVLTVRGGKVQVTGALAQQGAVTVGLGAGSQLSAPSFTQTGGQTTVLDGGDLRTTNLAAVSSGTLRGTGTVTPGGGLRVSGTGVLEPGVAGPGTLGVTGNLTLTDPGALALDVDGTASGSHDLLTVSGTAATGGVLDLRTGFAPALGDTVTVLRSGGTRSGTFADARGGDLPGDVSWAADYTATTVALRGATPSVSIADASVAEGNAGTTPLGLTVTGSEPILAPQRLTATPADGTATAGGPAVGGNDYEAAATTVTIPAGATSRQVEVTVKGDDVYEHDDDLTVTLGSPENATVGAGRAVGTIRNDEAVPTLSLTGASVIERDPGDAAANAATKAELSGPSAFTTTARWDTVPGTASAADYTARSAAVSFAPGVLVRSLPVTVTGDLTTEADETFDVAVSGGAPVGDVTLGAAATTTIRDDDAQVSVEPTRAQEPSSGTVAVPVRVSLSHPNPRPVTLTYATRDGSAVAPGDYVAVSPIALTIPAGATSRNVTVTVNSDPSPPVEGEETLSVDLASIQGGQAGTTTALVTIVPDRCTVPGTAGNDVLVGTSGDDVICGMGGNDTIRPGAGNDEIYGGSPGGADTGVDTLSYDDQSCGVLVDLRNAYASDPEGGPACIGAARDLVQGIENITGSAFDDTLRGDGGNNVILAGAGNDSLLGDAGDDRLTAGPGVDSASYVRGVSGVDLPGPAGARAGVVVDLLVTTAQDTDGAGLDTLSSVEALFGSTAADTLWGSNGVNTLSGLEGDDEIHGRAGNDIVYGLDGADRVWGDEANDRLFGGNGADVMLGGAGTDTLHGDADVDTLDGGEGDNDLVFGDAGVELAVHLSGGAGVGDFCGQGVNRNQGAVAGAGCENTP